ncbi:MAG: DUF4398 domain-containing protein [Desulfamplus sp.]|nr:DUF4398 domain-containing protein [Desulfamplus sp.]
MRTKCFILNCGMAIVLSLAATALVGCASKGVPPLKNISEAEMAIKVAKESNATINAPLDVRIAEEKLQKAKETVKKEDYNSAQRLADEALIDAKVAQTKSQTKKVKNMENEMRESIETLQHEVERNQKKY